MGTRRVAGAVRTVGMVAVRLAASLAGSLAYRRQELVVVGLLAASVLGGFAVDAWHRRAPALLDRLEGEPPRLVPRSVRASPAPPARPESRPRERAGRRAPSAPPAPASPGPDAPLDLDHATTEELLRLPGIGPRLAARIVSRRDELGGRFPSFADFASVPGIGARRAGLLHPRLRIAAEAEVAAEPPGPPP